MATNKKKKILMLMGATAAVGGATAVVSQSNIFEMKKSSIGELNDFLKSKKLLGKNTDIKSVIANNNWEGSPLSNYLKHKSRSASNVYASNTAAKPKYATSFKTHNNLYTMGRIKTMRFSIPFQSSNNGQKASFDIRTLNVLNSLNQFVSYDFKGLYVNEVKVDAGFDEAVKANKIIQNGEMGNWHKSIDYSDITPKHALFHENTNVDIKGMITKVEVEISLDNADFIQDVVIDQGDGENKYRDILLKTEDGNAFALDQTSARWTKEESIFSENTQSNRMTKGDLNWKPVVQSGDLFMDDSAVQDGYVRVYKDDVNSKWRTRESINSTKITEVTSGILPQEKLTDFTENDVTNIAKTSVSPKSFNEIDFKDAMNNLDVSIKGNDGFGKLEISDKRLQGFAEITSSKTKEVYYREIDKIDSLNSKDDVKLYLSPKPRYLFNNNMDSFIKEFKIRELDAKFNRDDIKLDIVSHFTSRFTTKTNLESMGAISEIKLNRLGLGEHTKISRIKVLDAFKHEVPYQIQEIRSLSSVDKAEAEYILQSSNRKNSIQIDQDPKNFNKDFGLTLKLLNTTRISSIQIFRDSLDPINISLKNEDNIRYTANAIQIASGGVWKRDTKPNNMTGHELKKFQNGNYNAQENMQVFGNSEINWDVVNDESIIERTGGLDSFGEITDMWMNFYPSYAKAGLTLTELKYYGSQANPEESWSEFNKKALYPNLDDRKAHFKINNFEALTGNLELSKWAKVNEYNNIDAAERILYNNTELDGTKAANNHWWPLWWYDRGHDVSQAFLTTHISVFDQNMVPGMQLSTIGIWGELWDKGRDGNLMDLIIKTKDNRIFKLIKGQEWFRKSKSGNLSSAFLSTTKKYKWVEMFAKPGATLAPIKNVWGNDYIRNLTSSEKLVWEFRFEGEQIWRELSNYVFHNYKKKIFLRAHRRKVLFTKNNKQIWREKLFDDGSKYTNEFGFNFTKITGLSKQQKVDPTEMRLKDKIYFSGTNGKGILNGINSLKEKYDVKYSVYRSGSKKDYDSAPVSLRNGDEVIMTVTPKAGSGILFVDSLGNALPNQSFEVKLGKVSALAEAKLTHLKNIPSDGFKITGSNFHGHFSNDLHDQIVSGTYDTYYYITRNGQRKLISINVLPTNFRNDDIIEIIAVAKEGFYFENNGSKDNFKKTIFKKEVKGLATPKAITNTTVPNDFVEEKNKNGFTLSKKSIQEIKDMLSHSSVKIIAQGKDNNIEDITNSYETHKFKDGDIIKFIMTAKDGFYFKGNANPNEITKVITVSRKNMNFKKALTKVDSPSGHIITSGTNGEAKLSFENKWLRQLYQNGLDFWFVVNGKKLKKNELPTNLKNGDSIEIITKIQDKNKYAWGDGSSSDITHSFQIQGLRENHDVTNPNIRVYERTKNNWRNIITGPAENVRVKPGVAGAQKTDKISSKLIHKNRISPAKLRTATTLSITGRAFSMQLKGGIKAFNGVHDDSIYGAVAQALFTSASRYERMKNLMKDFGTKLENVSIQEIKDAINAKKNGFWEYKFDYSMFTWADFLAMATSMHLDIPDKEKLKKNFNTNNHWGFLFKINKLDFSSGKPKINLRIEMNNDNGYNDLLAISNLTISLKDKNKEEVFNEKWDKMMVWDSSSWISRNGKHPSFLTPDTKKKKVVINQKDLISGVGAYSTPGSLIRLDFLDNDFIIQKKWLFGAIDRNFRSMKNGDWLAIAAETADPKRTAINDRSWFVQMKKIGELMKEVPLTDFPNTADKMFVRGTNGRGFIVGSLWDLSKINVKITLNGKVYNDPTDPGLTNLKNGDNLLVEVTPKKGFAFFDQDGIPLKNQTVSFHKKIDNLKDKLDDIDVDKVTDDFIDLPKLIKKLKAAIHYDVNSQKFSLELSLSDVIKDISKLTPEQQEILKKIKFFARYNGKQVKASLLELIKGASIVMNDVKPGASISVIVMPDKDSQFMKNQKTIVKSKELIKNLELKPEYFPKILAKEAEFKVREIEIVGVDGKGTLSPTGEFAKIVNDKRVIKRYLIANSKKEYEDFFEEVNGVKVLKPNIDPARWVDKLPTNFKNGQFVLAKISIDPNYKSPNGQRLYMIGKPKPADDFIVIGQEVSNLKKEVETPDPSLLKDSNPQFNNTGLTVVKTTKNPKNYIDEVELKVAPKFIEAINKIIRKHKDFKFELLLKKFNKAKGITSEETLEVVYNKDGTIKEVRIHRNKLDSSDDTLTLSIRILSNHAFNVEKQFNAKATKEDFVEQLNYKDVSIKDIKVNGKEIIPIIDVPRSEMDNTKAKLTSPFVDHQKLNIQNIKKMIRNMYKKYLDEHNGVLPTEHALVNLIVTDKNGKQKYKKLDILKAMDIMNDNEDVLVKIGDLLNANVAGSHLEVGDQISLEVVIPPTDKREFKYFDDQNVKHHGKTMQFKIKVVEVNGDEHKDVPQLLTKLPQPDLPRDLKFKNVNHRFNGKGIIDDKLTNLWKPRPHQKLYFMVKNTGAAPSANDKGWKEISSLDKNRKWHNGDKLYLKLVADDGFAFETSHGNLFEKVIISKVVANSLKDAIRVPNLAESKAFDWSKSFSSSPGHKILDKNNPLENFFPPSEREKVAFEWKIIHADGTSEIVNGDDIYNKKLSNGDKLAWRVLVKKKYLNQNGSSWVIFKDIIDGNGQPGVAEVSGGATNWGDNAEVNVPDSDQIIDEFKQDIFNKLGFNFIVDKKNGNHFKFAQNPFDLIPLNTDEKQHLHIDVEFIGPDGKKHTVRINYGDTLADVNSKISIIGDRSKSEIVIRVVAEKGVSFLKKGTTLLKKTIEFKINAFHHVVKTNPVLINGIDKIPENLGITGVDGEGKIDPAVLQKIKAIFDKAVKNGLTVSLIINRVDGTKVVAVNDWKKFVDEINRKGLNNKDAIGVSIDIGQNISKSFSIDGQDPTESFSKQFFVRGLKHLVKVNEGQVNIATPKNGVSGFAKGTIDLKGISQDVRERFNIKVYKIVSINGKEKKQEVLNWENGIVLKNNEVIQVELIAKDGNVFRSGQSIKNTIVKRIKISGLKQPIIAPKFPKNLVFHKKNGKIVDVNIGSASKSNVLIIATMNDGTVKEFHSKKEFLDALNSNVSPTDIAKIKYKIIPINKTTDALVDANGNVLGDEASSSEFVFGGNIHTPDQEKLDSTKGALRFNKKTSTGTINLSKVFKSNDPKKPYSTIKIGVMRRNNKNGKWEEVMEVLPSDFNREIKLEAGFEYKFVPRYINKADKDKFFITDANDDAIFKVNLLDKIDFLNKPTFSKLIIVGERNEKHIINKHIILGINKEKIKYVKVCINGKVINNVKNYKGIKNGDVITVEVVLKQGNKFKSNSAQTFTKSLKISGLKQDDGAEQYSKFPWVSVSVSLGLITLFGAGAGLTIFKKRKKNKKG
ncbi:hypothetical protein [Mycoplasma todarodis]|uniref:Uncharacterized protein n=1 Tax=Mycoplasma todarodis TaxID=1937191 RepID=A0A4R0XMY0_9MOLU|nr:hypothetical protein [Mycoplasma todarodis]TCG12071.1 hypothetical protein C4B25_00050 [Mycoplasma todarodis]